jgi:hypothetical protein
MGVGEQNEKRHFLEPSLPWEGKGGPFCRLDLEENPTN